MSALNKGPVKLSAPSLRPRLYLNPGDKGYIGEGSGRANRGRRMKGRMKSQPDIRRQVSDGDDCDVFVVTGCLSAFACLKLRPLSRLKLTIRTLRFRVLTRAFNKPLETEKTRVEVILA